MTAVIGHHRCGPDGPFEAPVQNNQPPRGAQRTPRCSGWHRGRAGRTGGRRHTGSQVFTLQTETLEIHHRGGPGAWWVCLPGCPGVLAVCPEPQSSNSSIRGPRVLGSALLPRPPHCWGSSRCALSLRDLSTLTRGTQEQKPRAGQLPAPYPAQPPRPLLPVPCAALPILTRCPRSALATHFRPSSLHQAALMPSPVLKPAGQAREPGSCPWEKQKLWEESRSCPPRPATPWLGDLAQVSALPWPHFFTCEMG